MNNQSNHIFQGLRQDNHPIRQKPEFLWEAHNVRLTSRDGNTLLSVTNERSTESVIKFKELNRKIQYIGHSIIGKYLIVFGTITGGPIYQGKPKPSIIYRVDLNTNTKKILYIGSLNFNPNYPIQAISDYESELVQKVYWTDGYNPIRVINAAKPELIDKNPIYDNESGYSDYYRDAPFNFIQDLELNETVSIKRNDKGIGVFPAGVVQYAFTYYNKYQQESNIFYVSELNYSTFKDRAGSPEETINTAFDIEIKNLDTKFDKLRIYSIIRTSIDSTPTVKRVVDLDVPKESNATITYTDSNTIGDIIDPQQLLYIGGKNIIADTICIKDNTLFLGNIKYVNEAASNITIDNNGDIKNLKDLAKTLSVTSGIRELVLHNGTTDYSKYTWNNQLIEGNTASFKKGQLYRLGFQLQHKTGEWSEPIYCRDLYQTKRAIINNNKLILPIFKSGLDSNIASQLINQGYKKIRPLVVLPETWDLDILAQGIVNPTVFNAENRYNNSPFAQSSWIFRPQDNDNTVAHLSTITNELQNTELVLQKPLGVKNNSNNLHNKEDIIVPSLKDINTNRKGTDVDNNKTRGDELKTTYFIDQSILTLNSPDIEFNDKISNVIAGEYGLDIVGAIPFTINNFFSKIELDSPTLGSDVQGVLELNDTEGLNTTSALLYNDYIADEKGIDETTKNMVIKAQDYVTSSNWMVYMWHRTGALNNDITVQGRNTTGLLKKKVFSQLKYSPYNTYFVSNPSLRYTADSISDLFLFNSNEVELIKLPKYGNEKHDYINYYGNIDTIVSSSVPYTHKLTAPKNYKINISADTEIIFTYKDVVEYKFSIKAGSYDAVTSKLDNGDNEVKARVDIDNVSVKIISSASDDAVTDSLNSPVYVSLAVYSLGDKLMYKNNWKVSIEDITKQIDNDKQSNFSLQKLESNTVLSNLTDITSTVGDYDQTKGLLLPKDPVRLKYKSTPHIVFAIEESLKDTISSDFHPLAPPLQGVRNTIVQLSDYNIKSEDLNNMIWNHVTTVDDYHVVNQSDANGLLLVDITRDFSSDINRFGGNTDEALQSNLWLPAGKAITLSTVDNTVIQWIWGDTWYQRYDCLKTYPFTKEDTNQVVEIASFMCDTRINLDGRYDRNRNLVDNTNISPENFNKINPVYSQKDNLFNYRILDSDYYKLQEFPNQIIWTMTKSPMSDIDAYTNITLANQLNLDGTKGHIKSIVAFDNNVVAFQDSALSRVLFNSRVQIQASDGVPIEIANSQKVDGTVYISDTVGCQDKFSSISTPLGIYFIDNNTSDIYLYSNKLYNLGTKLGNIYWVRNNSSSTKWKPIDTVDNGIRLSYDSINKEVYFIPGIDLSSNKTALCYSELLGQFTSTFDYTGSIIFSHNDKLNFIANDSDDELHLWRYSDDYNSLLGREKPFYISFISNDNPSYTKIFNTVEMRADKYSGDIINEYIGHIRQSGKPFNFINVSNEYQTTEDVFLNDSYLRKKMRVWRATVPREQGSRHRIVNPWTKITIGRKNYKDKGIDGNIGNNLTILHDLCVSYSV